MAALPALSEARALALQAFAGGPKGAFFNGNPVRWNNTQIPLILDNRDLGPFTAAEALDMVRVAAARWQDLPDSDFGFTSRTSTVPFQLSVPTSATQGIVFDNDGLLDDLLGAGASQSIFFREHHFRWLGSFGLDAPQRPTG